MNLTVDSNSEGSWIKVEVDGREVCRVLAKVVLGDTLDLEVFQLTPRRTLVELLIPIPLAEEVSRQLG